MDEKKSLESQIANLSFLEEIYKEYQKDPKKVDPSWIPFFQQIKEAKKEERASPSNPTQFSDTERIARLRDAYRRYGHLLANINPIALEKTFIPDQLNLEKLGFRSEEEESYFPTLNLLSEPLAPLKKIVEVLKKRYCQSIGFEFKDFTAPSVEAWIQQEIESGRLEQPLNMETKVLVLEMLTRAETLEIFLHTKHVGKKRFSLEGAETLIPMLAWVIAKAADQGIKEIFMGMSHRGRLNVLAHILNKPISSILQDFDDDYVPSPLEGMGDIRYHKGHANESVNTLHGKSIKLTLAPNPSHLESVDPVIEGQTHAKQFLVGDEKDRNQIIPLLLHGDAALAGQGVVYETLQMSQLPGFETGGTLHMVINNQIGFTTSPHEGRSTLYCTDIAKTFGAPVFHVNAEDPEKCIQVALFALDIRCRFHVDVFIDLNCYRKYGHNEGDEPAFTQPLDYQTIRKKKSIRQLYLDHLLQEGLITKQVADEKEDRVKQELQEVYENSQNKVEASQNRSQTSVKDSSFFTSVKTQVDLSLLRTVTEKFSQIPSDFHINDKIKSLIQGRYNTVFEDKPFDWGMAEFLAYGTLVWEGIAVRLVGQDSGRGTFSHRHALWVDQVNNEPYYPLAHLREGQGRFEALNTCLSEVAALGFEYGYSTVCIEGLNIWEAQFGDFANSAQVIIDQYIVSGEQKWGQASNLVLFLPHGFEGQGPEHSSARFERFLALAGHENIQIVNPTTPAQLFHLLRRQVKQPLKKPLVILTPKGLLRHPVCTSRIKDLIEGQFSFILDDPKKPKQIKRLILCSGRIYYDLDSQRVKEKKEDIAIIRIEQLYPLNISALKNVITQYGKFNDCLWVQEEPENMGAWPFISFYLAQCLPPNVPFSYVGRERSATPATGFYTRHKQELANILSQVFNT